MQLLIRKFQAGAQGKSVFNDVELQADVIHLGSSPTCEFQLLGGSVHARHARLQKFGPWLLLIAERNATVTVNGKKVKVARLKKDDEVRIADHVICVMASPAGFDCGVEWVVADVDESVLSSEYTTRLADIFVSPRLLVWLLLVLIGVYAIGTPFADYLKRYDKNEPVKAAEWRAERFLSSGPLHPVHQSVIGDNCEACHQKPFEQVKDEACTACHAQGTDHLPAWHKKHPQFADMACQNCHKEHNEPGALTMTASALCVDCHQDEKPAISGFSAQSHAGFELSLLLPVVTENKSSYQVDWETRRMQPAAGLKENSHLKFPHDIHMDAEKVRDSQTDAQLSCTTCHNLQADREHFEPIAMEKHCVACHDLGFDKREPQKYLPHGDPVRAWETLQAHFITKSFDENRRELEARRRIPGRTDPSMVCKNDVDCAKRLANDEAERQFTRSGCVTCHEVKVIENVEPRSRWQVLPVKLSTDWYALARFDHKSHLLQPGHEENELCLSCHKANVSKQSHDILIPDRDNCLQCHDDSVHGETVKLECVSCHAYHNDFSDLVEPVQDQPVNGDQK